MIEEFKEEKIINKRIEDFSEGKLKERLSCIRCTAEYYDDWLYDDSYSYEERKDCANIRNKDIGETINWLTKEGNLQEAIKWIEGYFHEDNFWNKELLETLHNERI